MISDTVLSVNKGIFLKFSIARPHNGRSKVTCTFLRSILIFSDIKENPHQAMFNKDEKLNGNLTYLIKGGSILLGFWSISFFILLIPWYELSIPFRLYFHDQE